MRQIATECHFMGSEPATCLAFPDNLNDPFRSSTQVCLDQKLQRTGLGYKSQAALMFSCKYSVPLMQPVAAIPTCSEFLFEGGWAGLNIILQKKSHHLKHLTVFASVCHMTDSQHPVINSWIWIVMHFNNFQPDCCALQFLIS